MHSSCALIYGKLPPEVRKEQARKFNDPTTNCKYLIATNAVSFIRIILAKLSDWYGS